MAVNRVDFGGNTLIDLTGDTLESAEQLMKGIIAHAKDGSVITGLMQVGGGGGGIVLPENFVVSSGSFVPATEGTGTTWDITIAKDINHPSSLPTPDVPLFALYRKDGFAASGKDTSRYLTAYIGLAGDVSCGCGAATYRKNSATVLTGSGGVESSTQNYGLPFVGANERSNCYVRKIYVDTPMLRFGTYGVVTLEAGCEYAWLAILNGSVYEV